MDNVPAPPEPASSPVARTDKDYWANVHGDRPVSLRGSEWPFAHWAGHLLPRGPATTCLEVGVFPGRNLLALHRLYGYQIFGVDNSDRLPAVAAAFAQEQVPLTLWHADFLTWEPPQLFDVVISHGFVEHFDRPEPVLARHWAAVKPGGLLVVSVPAATVVRRLLWRWAFTPATWRSIAAVHNQTTMHLGRLRRLVTTTGPCDLLLARFVNHFSFWWRVGMPEVRPGAAPLLAAVNFGQRVARHFDVSCRLFSPDILVVARRR